MNEKHQKFFQCEYKKHGINFISAPKGVIKIVRLLKKNYAILLALDQFSNKHKDLGLSIPFFGKQTFTYPTVAFLSKKTGASVIPSVTYRDLQGVHILEFLPALKWIEMPDEEKEIRMNTENYNRVLEQLIMKAPDQWCWNYRRWR